MEILDRVLDFTSLIFSSLALGFLLKAKNTPKIHLLRRGTLFLWLVIILEVLEDMVEIPLFGFVATIDDEDALALEIITLCQASTALYYIRKVKNEKTLEFLSVSILCTIWLVMAYALEVLLGLVFLE
ncbi:MAG: hypothetical protein Q6359_11130 [Candidatus Brocadiales bacterium]|nr:hypothetical protein [Candidatus Brocadiales bacterium]